MPKMPPIYLPKEVTEKGHEVLLPDPSSVVVDGEVVPTADGGKPQPGDDDYFVDPVQLLPDNSREAIEEQDAPDASRAVAHSIGAPIIRSLDEHDYSAGAALGVTDEGDPIPVDPNDLIIPKPYDTSRGDDPLTASPLEDSAEEMMDALLRKEGYAALADEIKRLGIGVVKAEDLIRPEFRSDLTGPQFAAYLTELGSFNGELREMILEAVSAEENDSSMSLLKEVARMYYGPGSYAITDRAPIADSARALLLRPKDIFSKDERQEKVGRYGRMLAGLTREDRIIEVVSAHASKFLGQVGVVDTPSGPVLRLIEPSEKS